MAPPTFLSRADRSWGEEAVLHVARQAGGGTKQDHHLPPLQPPQEVRPIIDWLVNQSIHIIKNISIPGVPKKVQRSIFVTVRAEIFAVVLFSRISRVTPSRKFPLQFMSIYSNDNISKIVKLTSHELPHLAKTAKITVRENNGVYSTLMFENIAYFYLSR